MNNVIVRLACTFNTYYVRNSNVCTLNIEQGWCRVNSVGRSTLGRNLGESLLEQGGCHKNGILFSVIGNKREDTSAWHFCLSIAVVFAADIYINGKYTFCQKKLLDIVPYHVQHRVKLLLWCSDCLNANAIPGQPS